MDVICILGRGIEKVKTSSGYVWRPTRLIEKLSEKGWHTGYRLQGLDPDNEFTVIAGSNANVLAAIQLLEELIKNGNPPQLIIFAAGRPPYLVDDPDPTLSEGTILAAKFVRSIKIDEANMPEIAIQSRNKNTRDDLEESLRLATEKGLKRLAVVTVSVHIERVREFFNLILKENPQFKNFDVSFFASEKVLLNRYRSVPLYKKLLARVEESAAYQETIEKERKGIEALRSGTYDFSSQGYEFASSTS